MNRTQLPRHVEISTDRDVALASEAGLELAAVAGLRKIDGVRFATAVSELTRNALTYGQNGRCTLSLRVTGHKYYLEAEVSDSGPGISDVEAALSRGYTTGHGLGFGLSGTQVLVDQFHLETSESGTTVRIALIRNVPAIDEKLK